MLRLFDLYTSMNNANYHNQLTCCWFEILFKGVVSHLKSRIFFNAIYTEQKITYYYQWNPPKTPNDIGNVDDFLSINLWNTIHVLTDKTCVLSKKII